MRVNKRGRGYCEHSFLLRNPAVAQSLIRATAIVALTGCNLGGAREIPEGNRVTHTRNQQLLPGHSYSSGELSEILYERNLISDPEINQKMNQAVLRITRDGAQPDSVMPKLLDWLKDWVSTHPVQVEAARLAGGAYTSEARRMYVDTESSRLAQIDSIRQLVRARAKRRIEVATDNRHAPLQ
jgi:hypothetical protein